MQFIEVLHTNVPQYLAVSCKVLCSVQHKKSAHIIENIRINLFRMPDHTIVRGGGYGGITCAAQRQIAPC